MIRTSLACVLAILLTSSPVRAAPPNIVMILADDLGPGEVGCYGSTLIKTPNIDALAKQGLTFTNAYAPAPLCSPTRCSLLTGLHQGHTPIRGNKELEPEGQMPLPAGTLTIAEVLHRAGYATACIGKWGLGPVNSEGDPLKMGFDFFYGHNCQRVAHNHYTDHLYRNDTRVDLAGNKVDNVRGAQYTPDLMCDEAVTWMKAQDKKPFFLYFATPLPHGSLQAPEADVAKYRGVIKETEKYPGKPGEYIECPEPHATYAAMVTKIDDHVGRIMATLKEMGVDDNTLVIFTSDNGPAIFGGADSAFFNSTEGRRGLKHDLYEGGIREPQIVRWPGHIKEGTQTPFVTALYDWAPTWAEMAGTSMAKTDGVSLLPALEGKTNDRDGYLYFEHAPKGGQRAVRQGKWKAVWIGLKDNPTLPGALYDLDADPAEANDVSKSHPDVMAALTKIRDTSHTPTTIKAWNF